MRRTEDGLILNRLGHRRGAPVGCFVGRRLVGQRDHPIDGLGGQRRNARGPGLVAGLPRDPLEHESLLPEPYRGFVLGLRFANLASARGVTQFHRAIA